MSGKNKKSFLSYLVNLMSHIIKWESEPSKRSTSWQRTIRNSRREISNIQRKQPSLNTDFLEQNWEHSTEKAIKEAEKEMQKPAPKRQLTWFEVFTKKYVLIAVVLIGIAVAGLLL